jgi:hypothetical protein
MFLWVLALATTAAQGTEEGPSCPPEIVRSVTNARSKAQTGSLLAAKQDHYESLVVDLRMQQCSLDLQLKVRREYGDVLAKLALRKKEEQQARYKGLAAEQYREYLKTYAEKIGPSKLGPPDEQQFPRVVLNAYANMMFETADYNSLCDFLAELGGSIPDLFDARVIEKWQKTVLAGSWDDTTRAARLREFCQLSTRPEVRISEGARTSFFRQCLQI